MIHKNTHVFYITDVLTHIIYITHIIYMTHMVTRKLIFKAYQKNCWNIFLFFFSVHKNVIIIIKERKAFKKAHERYQNLSEEEKEKKRQYGHERYKNLFEDEKQRLLTK